MNTIKALLEKFAESDSQGHYLQITVYTRGGNQFSGSLAKWDAKNSPNLLEITHASGGSYFVNLADIEAVSC